MKGDHYGLALSEKADKPELTLKGLVFFFSEVRVSKSTSQNTLFAGRKNSEVNSWS